MLTAIGEVRSGRQSVRVYESDLSVGDPLGS